MNSPGDFSEEKQSNLLGRPKFQFNLTTLLLVVSGVALISAARIHTEHYFGRVLLLAGVFAMAALFVTKVLRVPNDGSMRHEFIRKKKKLDD